MIKKLALIAILLHVSFCMDQSIEFLTSPRCNDHDLLASTCTWYTSCLQPAFNCNSNAYPLGYGNKYCSRFTNAMNMFTPMGKAWIQKTMVCLKKALAPYANSKVKSGRGVSCNQLTDIAFNSHPRCYVESGFCKLFTEQNFDDVVKTCKALWRVFDLKDLFQPRGVKQIAATLKTCKLSVTTYAKLSAACGLSFFQ